jgi:UDP-N-acetyl-D-galactosamine dehydrogenase
VHDAIADAGEARHEYGLELLPDLSKGGYDAVVGAVAHEAYAGLDGAGLARLTKAGGVIADIKGQWRALDLPDGLSRWEL